MIHAELGDTLAAFEHLERAFRERDFELYNLLTEPAFESMRFDPACAGLVRRMRLA